MNRQYDDDDGRTIINMDVDGMPWHDNRIRHEKRKRDKAACEDVLTDRQTARWIWYSLLAAFSVIFIIGGVIVLLIFIEWIVWKCKMGV